MPTSLPACSERNQRCSSTWWKTSAAGEPAPELLGHGGDRRLEHLVAPARRGDRLRHRPPLAPLDRLAEARDVVQHPPRLVLLRVEARQPQQPVAVVARLDDVRVEPEPVAVGRRLDLDLLDVEAELVQPVQPLVELEPLVRGRTSPRASARSRARGSGATTSSPSSSGSTSSGSPTSASTSSSSPIDVRPRDVEVVLALAVGQLAVQLTRLRVDEVGGERARVAPEERVRERAVAPEEAAEMQAREELGERVQEMRAQVGHGVARRRARGTAASSRGAA